MRQDGRLANGMRKISITPNYIKHAEGSCLIEAGNTRIICTASVEDKVPIFLKGKGTGWITAEYGMIPRSCETRIPRESTRGKKVGRTYEIQRLVGRSMRMACDMSKLGERTIWLDCDVIQADGGTRCTSITGSFVALCLALGHSKKQGIINAIPVNCAIAAVSVGIVKGDIYLDLTYEEDSRAEVDLNVVMTDSGKYVEVQGTAEGSPFSRQQMDEMLESARKGIDRVIKTQKDILKGVIS